MTSRDLVIRTLNHEPVNRIPRDLWVPSAVESSHRDELAELETRFPNDIVWPDFKIPPGKRSKGKPSRKGTHTDAWGCTWQVAEDGAIGTLEEPPLATVAAIAEYEPPWELLRGIDLAPINRNCAETSRFVLARTETRPFERFRGRVTFWGEIDRQKTLPLGTAEEVREAVLRVRKALDFGSGGVIAQCEWGPDMPIENLIAAFDQWAQSLPMHTN